MASRDIVRAIQDLTGLDWNERASSSGTAGTYLKARTGSGSRLIYYKLPRYNGVVIDGYECVNELLASRLMDALGIEHLAYRLIHAKHIHKSACQKLIHTLVAIDDHPVVARQLVVDEPRARPGTRLQVRTGSTR